MVKQIVKRDGRTVDFERKKIADAIFRAAQATGGQDYETAQNLAVEVEKMLDDELLCCPTVEQVQDMVEKVLVETGHARTAKKYILYRDERTRVREMNTRLMKVYEDLTFQSSFEMMLNVKTPISMVTPLWVLCLNMALRVLNSSMICLS